MGESLINSFGEHVSWTIFVLGDCGLFLMWEGEEIHVEVGSMGMEGREIWPRRGRKTRDGEEEER
jgi:hypothetical protein